ncbi:MAG: MaoC family dehydratase N-terminal domain-containing protein [Propionibacteriaceae bacterium]|nr:MaoC family dehydratase N-terminal domain-containing protein [Propionibacteriaceae bacterium]
MPISEVHQGRTYPATAPLRVTRERIRHFAAALSDADNPAYAGPDPIAPPTFAVVLSSAAWGAMFEDPDLGLSLSRTVHVDQRFTWQRPLRDGDEVTAVLTIERVRPRGATAIIGISVELQTTAGEPLCTATSTLMHTSEESA